MNRFQDGTHGFHAQIEPSSTKATYRERAGVGPLSREEAISYLTYFEENDWKTMKERIG